MVPGGRIQAGEASLTLIIHILLECVRFLRIYSSLYVLVCLFFYMIVHSLYSMCRIVFVYLIYIWLKKSSYGLYETPSLHICNICRCIIEDSVRACACVFSRDPPGLPQWWQLSVRGGEAFVGDVILYECCALFKVDSVCSIRVSLWRAASVLLFIRHVSLKNVW